MSTDDGPRGASPVQENRLRDLVAVMGGLVLAVLIAAGATVAVRREPAPAIVDTATSAARIPAQISAPIVPVARVEPGVAAAHERAVPLDILATSTVTAAPWAPGLRLKRAVLGDAWEARRAEIEDATNGDVRAYAIGDLLPHGSLLVGVSTATADIMVADTHLVRLHEDGRIEPIENLALAFEPAALTPARDLDPDYEDRVRVALLDLRSDDPTVVQAAIDRLIAAGDPAIELLITHVASPIPVRAAEYAFPSGSGVEMRPEVAGDLVIMILERITGQTFGDVTREGLTGEERATIAGAWERWWGR